MAALFAAIIAALSPALGKAVSDLLAYGESQTERAQFAAMCMNVGTGICADHPDWPLDQRLRYTRDAIAQLSIDQQVSLDLVVLVAATELVKALTSPSENP